METNNEVYIGSIGVDNNVKDEREVRFLRGYERMRIPLRNEFGQPIDVYIWAVSGILCLSIEGHIDATSINSQLASILCLDVTNFLVGKAVIEDLDGTERQGRVYVGDCTIHIWSDKDLEDPTHTISLRNAVEQLALSKEGN